MKLLDFALLLFVCFTWAAHTIVSKMVVSGMEIPPLFYAAVRYGIVAVFVLPWLFPIPRPIWRVILVGFLMGGGGFALFFMGIRGASPSSAAIVQQLGLPITALLSVAMLGERINLRRGIGIVLTFIGAVLVMWDPQGFSVSGGLVLILGSAVTGSLAAVMLKQIKDLKPLRFQAWVGLSSVIPIGFLSAGLETGQVTLSLQAGWPFAFAVLFSAVIVSLLSHTAYYALLLKHPANLVAPLMLMSPLMTVVLGIMITGDHFDTRMAFGTAIALLGVLIITLGRSQIRPIAIVLRKHFR